MQTIFENPILPAFFLCTQCGEVYKNGMRTLEAYCPICAEKKSRLLKMAVYDTEKFALAQQAAWRRSRENMEQILGSQSKKG